MSLAARCIAAIATGVVAADLPGKARAHVERRASAKRRPSTDRHPAVKAAKERKRAGKDERRAKVAAIREAVFARAGRRCEAWLAPHTVAPYRCGEYASILDHWLGGSGRRRAEESTTTCWALCETCNRDRTANHPDAAWWNESFRHHCERYAYRFTPHYDARAAQRGTKP